MAEKIKPKDAAGGDRFIPNTNKRYSITEEGIVFSNYRYNNTGKKVFNKREVSRHLNSKQNNLLVVNLQFGKYSLTNRGKSVFINTLMERCFLLTPPDKFHLYDLSFKDGDYFNSSLKNLEYKIRTYASSNYNFYPQPFYNLIGKITHKVCANCGKKKEIGYFNLQKPGSGARHKTYRNICEPCRARKQWVAIKADIERLKRQYLHQKKWAETDVGRKYYHAYKVAKSKYDKENLTLHYLASCLSMNQKDLTPELIALSRKRILLSRHIKEIPKC